MPRRQHNPIFDLHTITGLRHGDTVHMRRLCTVRATCTAPSAACVLSVQHLSSSSSIFSEIKAQINMKRGQEKQNYDND